MSIVLSEQNGGYDFQADSQVHDWRNFQIYMTSGVKLPYDFSDITIYIA